jgi:hypothetical protein
MNDDINMTEKILEISINLAKLMEQLSVMQKTLAADHEKKNKLVSSYYDLEERVGNLEEFNKELKKFLNLDRINIFNILKWLGLFAFGIMAVYNFSAVQYMTADMQFLKQALHGVNYEKSND